MGSCSTTAHNNTILYCAVMYRQRAAQGQSTTLAFYDWKGIKSLLQSTFKVPVMISAVNQKKKT